MSVVGSIYILTISYETYVFQTPHLFSRDYERFHGSQFIITTCI